MVNPREHRSKLIGLHQPQDIPHPVGTGLDPPDHPLLTDVNYFSLSTTIKIPDFCKGVNDRVGAKDRETKWSVA